MADPIDDDNELDGSASERAEDGKSGDGKKGKAGEGDSDSFGRGKAGAASGVKLSTQKTKEVWANFRHLVGQELMDAVVEFFSEGPMRASANAVVSFVNKTVTNVKTFAIVNWALEFGDKMVRELERTRERTVRGAGRDSRGFQRQRPRTQTATLGLNATPTGPTQQ